MSPEEVVQQQVEAYNTRDIEKFLACHDPNVNLYQFGNPVPYCTGRSQLREIYADVFDHSPDLHTKIINRMVMGDQVIDHEIVTGRKGVDALEIIAIYTVNNKMIAAAHFIRKT